MSNFVSNSLNKITFHTLLLVGGVFLKKNKKNYKTRIIVKQRSILFVHFCKIFSPVHPPKALSDEVFHTA